MLLEIRKTSLTHFNNDDEKEKWQADRNLFSVTVLLKQVLISIGHCIWLGQTSLMCIPLWSAGRNRTHGGWSRFLSVTLLHMSWTHQYKWAQSKMCSPFQTNHVIYERLARGAMATLRSKINLSIYIYIYNNCTIATVLINTIIFC